MQKKVSTPQRRTVTEPNSKEPDKHTPYKGRYGYKSFRSAVHRLALSIARKHKQQEL